MSESKDNWDDGLVDMRVMARQVQEIHERMFGNGKPGLIIEVDRLTQSEQKRQKTYYMSLSAIIGLIGKILYDVFSSKGN